MLSSLVNVALTGACMAVTQYCTLVLIAMETRLWRMLLFLNSYICLQFNFPFVPDMMQNYVSSEL